MRATRRLVVGVVALVAAWSGGQPAGAAGLATPPSGKGLLATLKKGHPRLILTDERLGELKRLMATDKLLRKCRDDVLKQADAYCGKPPLVFKPQGQPILGLSREAQKRTYALALAWRLTGKQRYAKKARENLLFVCSFRDWNPTHFLDTAEMNHAVGIGYDWLYDWLDGRTRETIRAALIEKGLKPAMKRYRRRGWVWGRIAPNWIHVCHGGLIIGSLAIAETDPKYVEVIVARALARLPVAFSNYAPDGAWPEGLGYWQYATRYTAYGLAALDTALGTDFGLSKAEGLSETGLFPIHGCGPTGLFLNFADAGERSRRGNMPFMFWLARKYDRPAFAGVQREAIAAGAGEAEDFIWYVPPGETKPEKLPLDKLFRGSVAVATFRSAWNDSGALYLGVKAGHNQVGHGHLDLGSFELDALGVRWARDLGSDSYSLPAYFAMGRGGRRWTYFRAGAFSHNVPILGGRNQNEYAKAAITRFKSKAQRAFAVLDLTSAYKDFSRKTTRGVAIVAKRRGVLIQDEFEIGKPCQVAWGITTDASITIKKDLATLKLDGKVLRARILSPKGAVFVAESAEQKPPQNSNKGVSRLMIRLKRQSGSVRIAVLLQPAWPDGKAAEPVRVTPLAEW